MDQNHVKIFVANQLEAINSEDALIKLAALLEEGGCTKKSFLPALLEREKAFPTGLELEGKYNVALAHADSEHVISTGFAIGVLKNPATFRNMGDPDQDLEVKIVFMMAAENSKVVISSIQKLTEDMFQKPDVIEKIAQMSTDMDLKTYIENIIC
ncbi:MAG: PTS sugar transporter subunit IIA [Chloroflexi bacterium]|jgi:PTS system galactitol-specific IIA component|nr:PTS sugar transporter subunit IIA [Chloroflexota bacterium]